jgi:hypothetical protein
MIEYPWALGDSRSFALTSAFSNLASGLYLLDLGLSLVLDLDL